MSDRGIYSYQVHLYLEDTDPTRFDAIVAAVRGAWRPILTDWMVYGSLAESPEMGVVGLVLDHTPEGLAQVLRDAIVGANGKACEVDIHIEPVLVAPGQEYHFGPRGKRTVTSLTKPNS